MEKSFAFNSDYIDGQYDREYFIEELLEYFADMFRHGISPFVENNLQVVANGDMSVTLKPGVLWDENGCKYKNTNDLVINLSPADGIRNRIDRISITWKNTEREMVSTVQEGEYAYNPKAPACRRNANYRDYVVADVLVRAGAVSITQANITDQRLDNNLCGMAAGLLQQFDPGELFIQIRTYFGEFKKQTDDSYAQFQKIMEDYISELNQDGTEAYDDFVIQMQDYFRQLSAQAQRKYDDFSTDLTTLTQQLIDFRNTHETEFLEWFEMIKGVFGTDPGGELLIRMNDLTEQVEFNQMMITTGNVLTQIETSEGDYLIDSMGNPILAGWPICKCK